MDVLKYVTNGTADEPTSGLDSETAWSTCQLLRKLADNGQAILCTIHQPSASLFQKFDRLLLLGNGGKTLYFGDIGADATILKDYFQKEGARPCLSEENPAEWLLNITGSNTGSVTAAASATDWSSVWNKSLEKHQVKDRLSITNMQQSTARLLKQGNAEGEYAASFLVQLGAVTRRNLEQDWRTPSYLYSKFMISIGTVSSLSWLAAGARIFDRYDRHCSSDFHSGCPQQASKVSRIKYLQSSSSWSSSVMSRS